MSCKICIKNSLHVGQKRDSGSVRGDEICKGTKIPTTIWWTGDACVEHSAPRADLPADQLRDSLLRSAKNHVRGVAARVHTSKSGQFVVAMIESHCLTIGSSMLVFLFACASLPHRVCWASDFSFPTDYGASTER
jgi:hypothetical protein